MKDAIPCSNAPPAFPMRMAWGFMDEAIVKLQTVNEMGKKGQLWAVAQARSVGRVTENEAPRIGYYDAAETLRTFSSFFLHLQPWSSSVRG